MTQAEPLDLMARRVLGDEGLWWRILDANSVLYPFRNHAPAASTASRQLRNTAASPAVTLMARYEGARGNNLRITVRDDAGNAAFDELVVYEFDGSANVELERYRYPDANVQQLVEQIEERSGCLTASLAVTGVALARVSALSLVGGVDGAAALAAELAPDDVLELPGAGPATRATRARSF